MASRLRSHCICARGRAPPRVRLRRYRVNVLDLSAFPLHESFVLSKPLIDLLGATLERTQVSFEGFATSLHMCSPDSPSIDRHTLEGAFLQTELLRMQRDSSVCISTPIYRVASATPAKNTCGRGVSNGRMSRRNRLVVHGWWLALIFFLFISRASSHV